jgi:hypothetical protein
VIQRELGDAVADDEPSHHGARPERSRRL